MDTSENVYARKSTPKNVLLVAISSNRGLAGGFNANVIKKTWSLINNDYKGCTITVLPIGKKVNDAFKRTDYIIHGSHLPHNLNEVFDSLTYDNVAPIAERVMEAFVLKDFDKVVLVYNQFKNAAVQVVQAEQFLPIEASESASTSSSNTDYIFEPSKEFIVSDLIPRSLKTQFYKALLDSLASEHGARMTAMHKATDNAKEMQRNLKIMYNKARQTAITTEILEIVAGAEALNG